MSRCKVDSTIERVTMEGFAFPLGAYPVEPMSPRPGYTVAFEPADGGPNGHPLPGDSGGFDTRPDPPDPPDISASPDQDDPDDPDPLDDDDPSELDDAADGWEEWPDRYVFDICISASRVESLCRALFALLPGRVYPILDVMGHDEYREIDPYVSYELVGIDVFLEGLRRFRGWLFEDGLVGFGAMSDEPFLYVFVDEHKMVTVRAETHLRERVEQVLAAYDLEQVDKIAGADAATHEHRAVLEAPENRPDLLTAEEIVEDLRDAWRLELNIDPDTNLDEDSQPLGVTGWRCIVRCEPDPPDSAGPAEPVPVRYAEVFLTADSLNQAEELAQQGADLVFAGAAPGSTPSAKPPAAAPPLGGGKIKRGQPAGPPGHAKPEGKSDPKSDSLSAQADEALFTFVVAADRLRPESFQAALDAAKKPAPDYTQARVLHAALLT